MHLSCEPSRIWSLLILCGLLVGCSDTDDSDGSGDATVVLPDSGRDITVDFGTGPDGTADVTNDATNAAAAAIARTMCFR